MSRKCHPDRNTSVAAPRMMQELNRAHEVLKGDLRKVYDGLGEAGLRKMKPETDGDSTRPDSGEESKERRDSHSHNRQKGAGGDSNETRPNEIFWQETKNDFLSYACKYSNMFLFLLLLLLSCTSVSCYFRRNYQISLIFKKKIYLIQFYQNSVFNNYLH